MQNNDNMLLHRFIDLKERAEDCDSLFSSDFLSLAEQQIILNVKELQNSCILLGGFELAERKLAIFGTTNPEEANAQKFLHLLKISPKQQKFADILSHRDFLGSILALGIKREMLGDILLNGNEAYAFVKPKISSFIIENLERVKRTSVLVQQIERLPNSAIEAPKETTLIAASARMDALLSSAFSLSRKDAQSLILSGKVFANGKEITKTDFTVLENTIISARGLGRFKLLSLEGSTRKGRSRFKILEYH